jgi:4-amino-4-deoxy-L-arabinose transferase-like glycosyltransferase
MGTVSDLRDLRDEKPQQPQKGEKSAVGSFPLREGFYVSLTRLPFLWLGGILLITLFCTNVYRAATQSIAHDEGLTYQWFLRGPFSNVWTRYNANNHILHTYLCRISIGIFGLSELSLRLPSLLGGALYLSGVYRICRHVFGHGSLFLLAVSLLSLNPFVLDYLSAARGYGMAIAFFLWALYYFTKLELREPPKKVFWKIGTAAGLAVSANLTLLFPVIALGMALLIWCWLADWRGTVMRMAARYALAPALLTMALILTLPGFYAGARLIAKRAAAQTTVQNAVHRIFYAGTPSLRIAFESLIRASLFRRPIDAGYSTAEPMAGPRAVEALALVCIVGTAVCFGGIIAAKMVRTEIHSATPSQKLLIITSATILITLFGVVLAHAVFRFPYPELRTGLYWLPLTTLALVSFAGVLPRGPSVILSLALSGLVCQYLAGFETRFYLEWRYSAAARPIMERIRSLASVHPNRPLCIGGTWLMEPSLNFYRDMFKLTSIEEIRRQPPEETQCEIYVLFGADRPLAARRQLHVVLDDPVSGTMLAVAPQDRETLR